MNPSRFLIAAALAFPAGLGHAGEVSAVSPPLRGLDEEAKERLSEECRKGALDLKKLLADKKTPTGNLESPAERDFVEAYFACQDLSAGRSEACDILKGMGGTWNESYDLCRIWRDQARLVWAEFRKGNAAAACRRFLSNPEVALKRQDFDRFCKIYIRAIRKGNTESFCGELAAKGLSLGAQAELPARAVPAAVPPQAGQADCRRGFAFLQGLPEKCPRGKDFLPDCERSAALIAALRAGDQAACQAEPFCAALARRNRACEAYRMKASRSFCAPILQEVKAVRAQRQAEKKRLKDLELEAKRRKFEEAERVKRIREEALKTKKQFRKREPMQAADPQVLEQMQKLESQADKEKKAR